MVHNNFKQLELLIDLLNDSCNNIFLHIDKKLKILPYPKFIIQLAAKLLRIAYAVMRDGTEFDYARAGVARSALKS